MPIIKDSNKTLFDNQRYHVVLDDGQTFLIDDLDHLTVSDRLHLTSILDLHTNSYSRDAQKWHDIAKFDPHQNKLV